MGRPVRLLAAERETLAGKADSDSPARKRPRLADGIDEGPADAPPDEPGIDERMRRALLGMQAGDALAAPIHWYYSIDIMKRHLREHFGVEELRTYSSVPESLQGKHPDSWAYMKSFNPDKCDIDIVHGKKELITRPGTFYHSHLAPGQVTHTVAISLLLVRAIAEDGGYEWEKYMKRYLDFWRTPGANDDTYVEIVHRHFFERLASGADLHNCGMEESCLSGFAVAMPLILATHHLPEGGALAAMEGHIRLTHNSDKLVAEARDVAKLIRSLLDGTAPKPAISACFDKFFVPRPGDKREAVSELAKLDRDSLFLGSNPYANAGEPGCAKFSLR